jgi:polysaccharide transporter, PST family
MKNSSTTIVSNGAWSLLNQIVRVGSLAAVIIALSRHFGPQRFGALAVGLALVRVFAVVASFGLDRVVVRHLVDQEERSAAIVRETFWLKLGIALLSYLAMLGLIFIFERGNTLLLCIAALAGGGLLFQACDVFDYAFQAQGRFPLSFLGRGVPILLSTALKLAAILANAPLLFFAALETVEAALIGTALYFIHRRSGSRSTVSILATTVVWPRLIAEGFPLFLGALAVMIYMRSDIIMLGKMAGYQVAGIYAAASQISEACALLPMALMPALFPVLVRWRRLGGDFYKLQFERLFLGAVLAGLCIATTLASAAPIIVRVLYGVDYSSAATILVVHAWTAIFIYIAIMQSGYDIIEGLTGVAAVRTALGAALNIVLNFALIPKYGGAGSAIATLISQVCSSFLFNFVHSRTRPIFAMQLNALLLIPLFRPILHRLGGGRSAELSRQFATSSE